VILFKPLFSVFKFQKVAKSKVDFDTVTCKTALKVTVELGACGGFEKVAFA
jgi:hypothetical protein